MSLHTGIGEVRDGDYVGTPLNRVARLLAAGYGGQTLLTQPTYELVRDTLPQDVTIKDRGEHRLKDLQRPERVYELLTSDLPSDFPPLKTLDNRPNNLPVQRSQLIGREEELIALQNEIMRSQTGLVTLTGPGGVGKTRLALQAAAELIDEFEDGVFTVLLSTIKDPTLLPITIAQALGVKEVQSQPVLDTLKEHLRDKELLLVLDNFEQVVAAAPVVAELMGAAPRLKVLATSRESLHLYGEQEFPVPPLDLPDPKKLPALEHLTQYEAVRLFIERAMSVKPDFQVTNENAPAVAEICHRLDGLPLAIELAAARIAILPPAAMLARLQSRLKLLTGGARDLPARQQTLRGALMWSYDLLDAEEQKLFRRISVFVDGCTLEGVEAVCNAEGDPSLRSGQVLEIDILDGVSSLINKSLLRQVEDALGEPRFTMLETIREYALERLEESGEAPALRRRHANFYLEIVERMEIDLMDGPTGPESVQLLKKTEVEYGNFRSALNWSQNESADPQFAMRLAGALFWFYDYSGLYLGEGRGWLESALKLDSTPQHSLTEARVKTLYGAAFSAFLQGDYPAARARVEESVALAREGGHKAYLAFALQLQAMVKQYQGEPNQSIAEESVDLFRQLRNTWGLAFALYTLGDIYLAEGNYAQARSRHEESLVYYRAANDPWGSTLPIISLGRISWIEGDYEQARSLVEEGLRLRMDMENKFMLAIAQASLADIARCQGQYEEATSLSEESLTTFKDISDTAGIAWSLHNLALIAYYQDRVTEASSLLKEGLSLRKEQGNKQGMVLCMAALAQVTTASGQHGRAARLFGAADAQFDARTARLSPADHKIYERDKVAASSSLGANFDASYSEGAQMSLDEAVDLALA
jgi:predicted ATPase